MSGFPALLPTLVSLLLISLPVCAEKHAWIIGGGYDLSSTQAQIEKNVQFAADVIREQSPLTRLNIYFTDGDDPLPDVYEWRPETANNAMQALARIYDMYIANGETYRNHSIANVSGNTDAAVLTPRLTREFAELDPSDSVLLIFNGHGGRGTFGPQSSKLWLWNDSSIDVTEMRRLLDNLHPEIPARYVFTQCYSGGFAELAAANTNRCGFMSVAANRKAEGCAAGVDIGDYRDYSTYFFAALQQRSRADTTLLFDPDHDQNNSVDMYEAHLYSLEAAISADIPRSTSEAYLLGWRPWYQWIVAQRRYDNVYSQIADRLRQRHSVGSDALLRQRRQSLEQREGLVINARNKVQGDIDLLAGTLQSRLQTRFPALQYPYTRNFTDFLQSGISALQAYISADSTYTQLIEKQQEYQLMKQQLLEIERQLMQLAKIQHVEKLANTLGYFTQHASAAEKARYQQLLGCEKSPL